MHQKPTRLITFLERNRTLYILLHLEPKGLRYTIIGQIVLPFLLGLQFLFISPALFSSPFYTPLTDLLPTRIIGAVWVAFALWMLFLVRYVRRTIIGYCLVWSAAFYVFWAAIWLLISVETQTPAVGGVLFAAQAWSLIAIAQTFIYQQQNVNGPRSSEFQ